MNWRREGRRRKSFLAFYLAKEKPEKPKVCDRNLKSLSKHENMAQVCRVNVVEGIVF